MYFRYDPGPCIVDGMPHHTCTAPNSEPIRQVVMPMRDGVVEPPLVGAVTRPSLVGAMPSTAPKLRAEQIQETLPEGHVTTGTYREKRKRP